MPFILGRPLGVPHDAAFQGRVLLAVLRLLETPAGPVLADYPEEAPATDSAEGVVCPVSFGTAQTETDLAVLFLREVDQLASWYHLALERRGRTSVGLSGTTPHEAAQTLAAALRGTTVACRPGLTLSETLKVACEDVRTYYYEAAAARSGNPDAGAIQSWFWRDTLGGRVFLALYRKWLAGSDKSLQQLCATSLVPKTVLVALPKT